MTHHTQYLQYDDIEAKTNQQCITPDDLKTNGVIFLRRHPHEGVGSREKDMLYHKTTRGRRLSDALSRVHGPGYPDTTSTVLTLVSVSEGAAPTGQWEQPPS
ncbi:hypothetical protein GCM10025751_20940 [Haladaptatus pallidirubidus]|uniref:Uncharacterized protein n=1 Tax=Haladaptatus pallidirubidus TaxID=1008152 RepID=A0AAV3UGE0_9EURY